MASNCKAIRAEIEEASAGAWLSRGAQAHVGECAACLGFMNEREALRRLVGGLERVEAPGDFEFRLRARMAAAQGAKAKRFSLLRPAPGLASFALAAVLVASVAAAYYLNRTTPTAEQATSHQPSGVTPTGGQQSSPASLKTAAVKQDATEVFKSGDEEEDKESAVAPPSKVEKAAGLRPSRHERRRAASRAAAAEPRVEVAKAQPEGALEFGLSTSPVVKGTNGKVEVSSEPLRVVLRDGRGTRRRLEMNPVSFGAQNPVGKRRGPTPTTAADDEGVW